jgi:hypothetical protein
LDNHLLPVLTRHGDDLGCFVIPLFILACAMDDAEGWHAIVDFHGNSGFGHIIFFRFTNHP